MGTEMTKEEIKQFVQRMTPDEKEFSRLLFKATHKEVCQMIVIMQKIMDDDPEVIKLAEMAEHSPKEARSAIMAYLETVEDEVQAELDKYKVTAAC